MSAPFSNISSIFKSLPLRALMLFSLILMFMAAHVYITSQPINSVVMAEILEEHDEDAHDYNIDSERAFLLSPHSFLLKFSPLQSNSAKSLLNFSTIKEVYSVDPPPPKSQSFFSVG